ncbi:hypothetical protein D3C84_120580 [compost metagenome]
MPEETDGAGDRAAGRGVVGISDVCRRYRQPLADGGRRIVDPQRTDWLRVQTAEHERLIGELQPLDMAEGVGPVPAGDTVGDRKGAVDVFDHGVIRQIAGEQRRVEVGTGRRQDFAHALELAGVIGAVHHERNQGCQAIEGSDFRSGAIDVLPHADAHIEPLVAVDQVVAAAALDDVAAGATQEDVAPVEFVVGRAGDAIRAVAGAADQVPQTADQVEVGEHAALGASDGEQVGSGVIAAEEVGMGRSRQPFHQVQPGKDRRVGTRHRRLIEEAQPGVEVHGHAAWIVLVGRPVVPGEPDETVRLAGTADHDVITALPVEIVRSAIAQEDVVAIDRIVAEGVEVVTGNAIGGSALDPVIAFTAAREFIRLAAEDEVVAQATAGVGRVFAGDDEVLAGLAKDQVEAVAALDDIVAVLAVDDVVAPHVGDDVVTGTAKELVVAVAAIDPVVTGIAVDRVVVRVTGNEDVVAGRTAQHDRIGAGVVQVVGVRARRGGIVADHQRREEVSAR